MYRPIRLTSVPWGNRWCQLLIGMVCMALVANLQYGWTLFVEPLHLQRHWDEASIQLAFAIFVLTETWLVPIEGWLVDRFGPRPVVAAGAAFAGLAWILDAHATTLPMLYVAAFIGGLGAGCVYGTCVGNALKWFPDRRGFAAGLTAAGFGAGAAISVIPIAHMIVRSGYQHAFFFFGVLQGSCILALALLLVKPVLRHAAAPRSSLAVTRVQYSPSRVVRAPVFWVMYAAFVAVAAGGLMATAQLGPIAHDRGFAGMPLTLFGMTLPLLTATLSLDNVCNGFTRPLCGLLSDRIGRENTMFIVFLGEGLALLGLMLFGTHPYAFVVCAALIFVFWGEIYSIFPALCADTFGSQFAAANAGMLYTAKGTAALLVPVASLLAVTAGGWDTVFLVSAVLTITAAIAAKFVLAPMRTRWIAGRRTGDAQAGLPQPGNPPHVTTTR